MKISTNKPPSGQQDPPDLSLQTFSEAKSANQGTKAILDLLEAPPESDEPDPILELMDLLMKIEQRAIRIEKRIVRIEKRLGIGSSGSSHPQS